MVHVKWLMQHSDKNIKNTVDFLNLQHHYGNVGKWDLYQGAIENTVIGEKVVDVCIVECDVVPVLWEVIKCAYELEKQGPEGIWV